MLRRITFDLRYRFGRPPWDTGVTPPELVAYIDAVAPGRALDLGCGSGTNVVYLARHGWEAIGIDFAPRAVSLARQRARRAGLTDVARFLVADVARLPELGAPFDLALDMGCLHSVPRERHADYAAGLVARLAPGAAYLLYAFSPPDPLGLSRDEVTALFSALRLESYVAGSGRPSAWYRFRQS